MDRPSTPPSHRRRMAIYHPRMSPTPLEDATKIMLPVGLPPLAFRPEALSQALDSDADRKPDFSSFSWAQPSRGPFSVVPMSPRTVAADAKTGERFESVRPGNE
ncbi:hypothetical protein VTJ83DRAFT_3831 [Remersonia thermophila]|uniref:Uncharacterized protein n=1 Tax=Remersonia thermophila TaxID=72144 RepID=A0ABR4DF54_9PEZI